MTLQVKVTFILKIFNIDVYIYLYILSAQICKFYFYGAKTEV